MQSTQCLSCSNYFAALTCRAFPDGIPAEIVTGRFDHTQPYEGDHGVRFELDPNWEDYETETA